MGVVGCLDSKADATGAIIGPQDGGKPIVAGHEREPADRRVDDLVDMTLRCSVVDCVHCRLL
jgi:hypothetical protein